MPPRSLGQLSFTGVYPHYVAKATRKGRTQAEVDAVICWLTGYSPEALHGHTEQPIDFRTFFAQAPALHPHWEQVTGTICGVRIEALEDPLDRQVRVLDKLVEELARGKALAKVLRP